MEPFKYVRIQGREIADFTNYPNGVFGIFRDFEKKHVMTDEDAELYQEVVDYFTTTLPWSPICAEKKESSAFSRPGMPTA